MLKASLAALCLGVAGVSCASTGATMGTTTGTTDPAQVREQEIRQCLPGDLITWGDGRDRAAPSRTLFFTYNPANAPADFPESQVSDMIRQAANVWTHCGLAIYWAAYAPSLERQPEVRVIAWLRPQDDDGSVIGKADMGRNQLWLSPKIFALLRERNPTLMASTLQMTLAHEMGHFLGLVAHSRHCVDVTSYYTDAGGNKCLTGNAKGIRSVPGLVEYRSVLPTACDIARCRSANGFPPLPDGRLP